MTSLVLNNRAQLFEINRDWNVEKHGKYIQITFFDIRRYFEVSMYEIT